ncbi:MAG: putative glycoside hydrolase [Oligoflexia bacterium]|nr:putative glycoside hydrolase [Oligoflexia bacterium]
MRKLNLSKLNFALFLIPLALTVALISSRAADNQQPIEDPLVLVQESDGLPSWGFDIQGEISDREGRPVPSVSLILNGVETLSDEQGVFRVVSESTNSPLLVKKAGFRKALIYPRRGALQITLEPHEIKGVYLQTGLLRKKGETYQNIMELLRTTELNALTIDVKDDEGRISTGLRPYIDELRAQGIYTIARIVTFKDNIAPRKNPNLAVINGKTGKPWEDRNRVTYLDPFNEAAWDHVIGVAKAAVEQGFDEIQFDYVRFPTDGDRSAIRYDIRGELNSKTRTAAIAGFLKKARAALSPMGAFVAADVFGITAYDKNDSGIGQRVEDITPYLDYVCPMVYPSGYAKGTGGVKDPVAQPGDIVEDSVRRYRLRSDPDVIIRPWLQAFRDYAYSRRDYTGADIRAQIDGSDRQNGQGFLLWNAASRYKQDGLKKKSKSVRTRGGKRGLL